MNRTFSELCEELKRIDEITLLELLEISSEEIVDKFEDKIRRVGISNNIDEQTAIITGSIGETLVSGLTLPLIKKIKNIIIQDYIKKINLYRV